MKTKTGNKTKKNKNKKLKRLLIFATKCPIFPCQTLCRRTLKVATTIVNRNALTAILTGGKDAMRA